MNAHSHPITAIALAIMITLGLTWQQARPIAYANLSSSLPFTQLANTSHTWHNPHL